LNLIQNTVILLTFKSQHLELGQSKVLIGRRDTLSDKKVLKEELLTDEDQKEAVELAEQTLKSLLNGTLKIETKVNHGEKYSGANERKSFEKFIEYLKSENFELLQVY